VTFFGSPGAKDDKSNNYSADVSPYGSAKAVVSRSSAELFVWTTKR